MYKVPHYCNPLGFLVTAVCSLLSQCSTLVRTLLLCDASSQWEIAIYSWLRL